MKVKFLTKTMETNPYKPLGKYLEHDSEAF